MQNKKSFSVNKKILFTTIFLVLLAAIAFLFELSLGLFSVGISTKPFESIAGKPGFLRDNRDEYVKKYMSYTDSTDLDLIPNFFREKKKDGQLRGIVLGESTPQGVPYGVNQSFPKLAEVYLNQTGTETEILNVAASAMTSFYLKDAAKKIRVYSPDFVVIYAGHNEYYGTVSVSTGSNPLFQDLYINLKESRILQSLFNLYSSKPDPKGGALMARQYAGRTFPRGSPVEEKVETLFLQNYKDALDTLTAAGIKVFVMKPVCNLISFPPFRGSAEELLKDDLKRLSEVLKSGALSSEDVALLEKLNQSYPESAHLRWLKGQQSLRTGDIEAARKDFVEAKDLDMVPFRARSGLIASLEDYINQRALKDPLVRWVDTGALLENPDGLLSYSWMYFIDQLHFNRRGHYKIGAGLAEVIGQAYGINMDNQESFQLPVYTPWDEFMAALRMARLALESPYKDMTIPLGFQLADHVEPVNPFLLNDQLRNLISSADNYDNPLFYLNKFFLEAKDFSSWEYYLAAEVWKNPGSPGPYLERGNFLAGFADRRDAALKDWKMAVQLSEYPEALKTEIREKMDASGMSAWWDRFEKSLKAPD